MLSDESILYKLISQLFHAMSRLNVEGMFAKYDMNHTCGRG